MKGDVGSLTAAALGIAASPVAFLLALGMLGTRTPLRNTAAFVSGQAVAVAGVAAAAVFLVADGRGVSDSWATRFAALDVFVGSLLAVLLVAHLRRPRRSAGRPSWASSLDGLATPWAFAGGVAVIAANPKNLALTLGGAAAIVRLGSSPGDQAVGVLIFTAVAVSVLGLLLLAAAARPSQAVSLAWRGESFVLAHERRAVAAALALLAVFFLGRGLLALV